MLKVILIVLNCFCLYTRQVFRYINNFLGYDKYCNDIDSSGFLDLVDIDICLVSLNWRITFLLINILKIAKGIVTKSSISPVVRKRYLQILDGKLVLFFKTLSNEQQMKILILILLLTLWVILVLQSVAV